MRTLHSALIARALVCLAALVQEPAFAQTTADLTIDAQILPPGPIRPGSVAQIVLTLRNLGPADAVAVAAISSGYPFLTGGYFDLFPVFPNACKVFYDDFVGPPGVPGQSFLVAAVLAGNIPAGGNRVCTMGLFVYPESNGPYGLSFRIDSGTPDDNASNDIVTLGLVFAEPTPRPIPAGSHWAWLAFAAVLAAVASRHSTAEPHKRATIPCNT